MTETEQLQRIYGVVEGWLVGDIDDDAGEVVGRIIAIRDEADEEQQGEGS